MQQRANPGTRWAVPGSLVCVLALAVAGATPVRAADQGPDQAAPAAASARTAPALDELAAGGYEITLLTGDEVRLDVHPGGRFGVDVAPAPRPDGTTPGVEWYTEDGGLSVVPSDVAPLLDSGLLDRQLFDVAYLAAHGYADGDAGTLPVIVEYAARVPAGAVARRSGDLTAGTRTATLESLNAAGVSIDKDDAATFWASLAGAPPAGPAAAPPAAATALSAGVEKVWLDRKVEVALDGSVPQIGAPQAWDAGYDGTGVTVAVLDSGIDATHPDLADRVAASRSFIESEDVVDGHGHGTHVASIVAGTGVASDGQYTGVAPGAELVVGKVLDDTGFGPISGVIEGMEWATLTQGADVVNLSIGSAPSDGNDPLSQAVNNLTATTGALFVISAGNDGAGDAPPGAGDYTINSPGAATAALTVGAVDKSDRLAFFSSRGPRPGDSALKPEITAPGRAIVAARAAGTSMGTPVDDFYTAEDGTSMAAPHVAGTAAIVKQRHPDWDAGELKAALVATADDVTGSRTVYQRGAGRVDAARAVRQQVQVRPALADFGYRPFDDRGDPVTRTLRYTNPTDQDVTLRLDAELTTVPDFPVPGDPVPEGTLTLDAGTLTVPAGGMASLAVTLDPGELDTDLYSGSIVGRDDRAGIRLTTPIGLSIGEIRHKITIDLVDRTCDNGVLCPDRGTSFEWGVRSFIPVERFGAGQGGSATGASAGAGSPAHLTSTEPDQAEGGLQLVGYVEPGVYMLRQLARWVDADTREPVTALLWAPEIVVDSTARATVDANDAQIYAFEVPRPATRISVATEFARLGAPTGQSSAGGLLGGGLHASNPTREVTVGTFLTSHQEVLTGPPPGTAAADSDERPYAYFLKPHELGRIPESLTYRFTHDELAIIDAHYHRADPGPLLHTGAVHHPLGPLGATRYLQELAGPVAQTEYRGPVSADLVRFRQIVDPAADGAWREGESYAVFDQATRTTQHWNQPPLVPAATLGGSEVAAAFDFRTEICAGCRQNDTFFPAQPHTFFPTMDLATLRHDDRGWRATFDALSAAGDVRLEHNGQEIPVSLFIGSVPSFALPAGTGRYRLSLDVAAPPERIGPAEGFTPSRTAWELTSGPVTADRIPDGYVCMGNAFFFGSGGDCRPDPLIFLRYDLGLDLANRAAAPGAHRFEVTAYRQPSLVGMPDVAGLRLWTSDDGGEDWDEARVFPLGDGRFRIVAVYLPAHRRDSDTISIRTEAWDASGNRVAQTVLDAYQLTDRRPTDRPGPSEGM